MNNTEFLALLEVVKAVAEKAIADREHDFGCPVTDRNVDDLVQDFTNRFVD